MTRVLIVGARIGGLTTAPSLYAAGVDKARELTPAGVGINLQPHAVRELTELRLGEAPAALGVSTLEWIGGGPAGSRCWRRRAPDVSDRLQRRVAGDPGRAAARVPSHDRAGRARRARRVRARTPWIPSGGPEPDDGVVRASVRP
jgi:hypothetical protein